MIKDRNIIDVQFQIVRGKLSQYPASFCYELRVLDAMQKTTENVGYLSKGYSRKLALFTSSFDSFVADEYHDIKEQEQVQYINLLKMRRTAHA